MPHRLARRSVQWVGRHANILLTCLLMLSMALALVAVIGFNKARDAQSRVNAIELERTQEAIGKRVADVATCFNRARSRPQLALVLRGIAGQFEDGDARRAALSIVMDYERTTPGRADCIALAKKLEVDPGPYLDNPEPDGVGQVPQR